MPLFGKVCTCPNPSCAFDQPLKEGEKCPKCGVDAKTIGLREAVALASSKRDAQKTSRSGDAATGGGKGGFYCPNPRCTYVTEMRQGEKCPVCGTVAQSDDVQEGGPGGKGKGDGDGLLFTESTTDDEIAKKIRQGLDRLGNLDKGSAVYEQNRVIMLQNELILRKLRNR